MAIDVLWEAPQGATESRSMGSVFASPAGYLSPFVMMDLRRRVVGYRMTWRHRDGQGTSRAADLRAMAECLAENLNPGRRGWKLGRTPLFLDVTTDLSLLACVEALPQENVVLCVGPQDIGQESLPALQFMRDRGFSLMLRGAAEPPPPGPMREVFTHLDVGAGKDADLLDRLAQEQEEGGLPLRLILTEPGEPAPCAQADDGNLQPESMLIVRLMQMLQRNEDVRQIETALKHDAVLTYRLLRHINSPAIGPGVEIQSLRHAVTMLGYSHLFRWLALLLATSSSASGSPFLTRKAIMRGRAVELLGKSMLTPTDADNLFVVGMFSMIDQLLGVPMQEVLGRVQLAESVQQAILHRGGVYGPFLALAESCERESGDTARLAEDLFMSPAQVNAAVLQALMWAQEVGAAESPY